MSSTESSVARKTGTATLVINNFSHQTSIRLSPSYFSVDYFAYNDFGCQPRDFILNEEYVSVCLFNNHDKFAFLVSVSILNSVGEKLFTKETLGAFENGICKHHFSLMPRSKILLPENGYLSNDKLTLLCEVELIEDEKTTESKDFNNLSENFASLLNDGKFADTTLVVDKDEKEFYVHKNILAARSPVFAAMFEHDCEEKRQNKVIITDMDEDVCGELLSYIYTGKVKGLDRFAMELLVAADKYQVLSLKSICTQYMCNHLSVESVANVLILADLHQATALKDKCIEYICGNVGRVQATDGWKLLDTKPNLLKELFIYLANKK